MYTSAVHLYLRSIFTAGGAALLFYLLAPSLFTLWITISERFGIIQIRILIAHNLDGYSF